MDFDPSEEQGMALDGWRRFVASDIAPLVRPFRDRAFTPEVAHQLLAMMAPYGVGSGWIPEDGGGPGYDFLTSGLLFEALARVSPDAAGLAWVAEGAALKLYANGSPALRERYLPGMLQGAIIGCSAISEPGIGSSVREMRTRAVRDGDHYRITGEKMWTSNAAVADVAIVVARTGEQEFSMFLVDRAEHGFETREIDKLGLNGWSMGQMVLDDVRVPATNLLGGLGAGLRETMKGFDRSRCFVSTLALGIAQAALDDAVEYACQRTQFGKPIAGHQLVQGLLAEMVSDLEASRLLVYRALAMMSQGKRCEMQAAIAKSFTTEAAQRITSKSIQVHGAFGLTREFPVERHFRNARMLTIPDGTTQINQLIIGRKLTGIDAFA
ncbi:acyl-CoA dehydrogenase family protein [Bordetella bronchiseptica]|uniref:acyl-CoA dehydrogenase family protein n=1 Tax=Bordetella bronchiseptica TaxID=518 RepID=UPI00028ACD7E|nr:acyl-CoA dehydrogenase family protein [Bordetella bronchiseptica]KDD50205.1 putative acyl-CoA dehydrogenase [Bordetella bronchiseptica OSU553]AUL14821.1 acyl-CoA dehydrogenase [Bordetella bronchiseptica]AWP57917.1 acyl-CoA dehydrogenase [Bordetella bronchiseptica]AWQ04650.1 acyl-CoA dehydrogenase [Bordetella bronchiseptica]AZW30215.1 acyl-CoA dehydrogenase [Bordetella bronchiseptica]